MRWKPQRIIRVYNMIIIFTKLEEDVYARSTHRYLSSFFLVAVLQSALKENFAEAQVSVVDCPDLTKSPFHLADPGMLHV